MPNQEQLPRSKQSTYSNAAPGKTEKHVITDAKTTESSWFKQGRNQIALLLIMATATLSIRFLIYHHLNHTGLLYVALPFSIAIALIVFTRSPTGDSLHRQYGRLLRRSMIILLGSSALLQEGFLCVLFLIPIYLVMITVGYLFMLILLRIKGKRALYSFALPVLVLLGALDGVMPKSNNTRMHQVKVSQVIALSPDEIKINLLHAMQLPVSDNPILALFPMPKRVIANSFTPGELHEVHYVYNRWVYGNRHEGKMVLRVGQVTDDEINMQVIEDSSYLSHYMNLQRTRLAMQPLHDGRTEVTMTVKFERTLDPAWYFAPLEQYVVAKMSAHILTEVAQHE